MTEFVDAYADASGDPTTRGETIFTINGCISTPALWSEFQIAFQAYLESEKFKPDQNTGNYVFHTANFKAGRCKWMPDGLTPRDKQRIGLRVAELIRDHTLYRFGYGMQFTELERLEADFPHVKEYFGSTGVYLSKVCFEANKHWIKDNGFHPAVNYMFDQGDDFLGELSTIYREACKALPSKDQRSVGDFTVGNKREHSALQAADFVAWHARNYFRSLSSGHRTGLISPKKPDPEMMVLNIPGSSSLLLKRYSDLRDELSADTQEFLNATDGHLKWQGEGTPFPTIDDLTRYLVWTEKDIKDEERQRSLDEWFAKKAAKQQKRDGKTENRRI